MIYSRALNEALHRVLGEDSRVVVLGEDIADPYGGAFKVSRGLTTAFPERVKTTPVSEQAIAGLAAGLALGGYRPIAEVMFGDFLALCFDQVLNHITKYHAMYAGQAHCPVMFRAPMGGHRGYGPTHSQSIEKHFIGIPHLRVVAASPYHEPYDVLADFLAKDDPVLFVEHKLLYAKHVTAPVNGHVGDLIATHEGSAGVLPSVCLSLVPRAECALTIVAYGYEAQLAASVVEKLGMEDELFCELVVPAQIAPVDFAPIAASVAATGRLLTVEEGTSGWSWGDGVASTIQRSCFGRLKRPVEVLASQPTVIPGARRLEQEMLVGAHHIEKKIREALS